MTSTKGLIFAQKWPDPEAIDMNVKARVRDLTGYETVWMYILGDNSETDWWDKGEVEDTHKAKEQGESEQEHS